MKKFLLTSLAALFAVVMFAQRGLTKQFVEPVLETNPVANTFRTLDPHAMVKHVTAPAMKLNGKKPLRRAAISDISELEGEFIAASHRYGYDSEAGTVVPAAVTRQGASARIEVTGANTIAIYGIDVNADFDTPIQATVDIENNKITIPGGQTIWTYSDETGDLPIFMLNAEADDDKADLTATIWEGGFISIDQLWCEAYYEEGQLQLNGAYNSTFMALANGVMEYYSSYEESNVTQNVLIMQDTDTQVVTVWNVHDFVSGMVMDVNIYADKTFAVPGGEQVVYMHSSYNEIYLWGSPQAGVISDITGAVVDDNKLVSDVGFGYVNAAYRGWVYPDDKFTITLIDGTTFAYPAIETGELVTPPDGLVTKDYPFTATLYTATVEDYSATVKIGIDGNNVYFQGLDKDLPQAWVKGEFNPAKTKVGIPVTYTGLVGESEVHYFAAYGGSEGPDSLFLNYDADADTYDYGATVMIYKGSASTAYAYFYNGFFIGTKPTPTVAPEGLVTTDMPYTGRKLNDDTKEVEDVEGTVKVGVDGTDVYVQGLFSEVEGGWIKGTFVEAEGTTFAVFEKNQYIGNLDNGLSAYIVGYDEDEEDNPIASVVVFLYDKENNYYSLLNPMILTRFKDGIDNLETYFSSLTIGTIPDGIAVAKSDVKANGQMFNLAGQRVGKDYKGMVIVNGKKFMNK